MNCSFGLVRVCLLVATLFYVAGLICSYSTYLVWQDYVPFFNYEGVSPEEYFILFLFISVVVLFLPLKLKNSSDVFVWVLSFLLYIPICVFYVGSADVFDLSGLLVLIVLVLSFLFIALPSYLMRQCEGLCADICSYNYNKLISFLMIVWVVLLVFLAEKYASIIAFRGLDEVYIQRSLGKADSLLYGYAQVYFGYVVSVALIVFGLSCKQKMGLLLGVFGCIFLYSITAERTIFILPAFVGVVYLLVTSKEPIFWLVLLIFCLAFYFFIIALWGDYNKFFKDLGFYGLTRVVAIPGQFFVDYLNYFSEVGYTNYSHAKGFNLFFTASPVLAQDPFFPELGRIIARDVHGVDSNSNASFLSTDGVAALGLLGVLIVSLVLSVALLIINFLTRRWPLKITLPLLAPIALTLTNGSFFTVLLSFGLLFWMFVFLLSRFTFRS